MTPDEKDAVISAKLGAMRIETVCDMLSNACRDADAELAFDAVSQLASNLAQQLGAIATG